MILITGSTGFIGRSLIAKLTRSFPKSSLLCWIWTKAGPDDALGKLLVSRLGLSTQFIDLNTGEGIKIPKVPETIIHLAAVTDTSQSDYSVNDIGTQKLLSAIPNLGPLVHIIYSGTTAIMSGRPDCTSSFSENRPYFATNGYSRSKLAAEQILTRECQLKKFRLTILRFPTVYGNHPRHNSFFDVLKKQASQQSIASRINWPGLTDFLHVDDAADSIVRFTKSPPPPGRPQTYIVSAESLTLSQIFPLLYRDLGISYQPVTLPPLFWKTVAFLRPVLYQLEPILPGRVYNQLWRASLVIANVIYTDSTKYRRRFPSWRPKYLKNHLPSLNVTAEEIQHFSQLEHIWWGAQTTVGQIRYDLKAEKFKECIPDFKNKKVLEIGCGDGEFTKRILNFGAKIIATDVTPAVVQRGRQLIHHPSVKFIVDNAEKMKFANKSMDVVCGVSILHHVNIKKVLSESYRVLKPGGQLFFTEPNLINPQIFLGLHVPFLRRRWEFSPSETALIRWQVEGRLRRVGFRTIRVVNYDFLHPLTPTPLIKVVHRMSQLLERTPLLKEISGSLLIYAQK
ncbi:hypothetical protein A2886_01825 [candidate division WWE3 bacterium RIFCSPHIGHO2_01_FULL_42_13]|uniref:Methyltransferase type 11 domain-containing protein n=1 Tax=candidate division WWE3 bacterium RIFCSPHIGHO2_01_FULL_42_13 TaxID=1802617 RepID=A0A1F4US14_UNCKA|nr:MAG: hypothetical protein A2886_01825 [candidate division WWE3 bacterium RIFCSPHIGHO2_01_FULL_42_13]